MIVLYPIRLADYSVQDVIEWYARRADAEHALASVVEDEPDFEHILAIVPIEFELSPN